MYQYVYTVSVCINDMYRARNYTYPVYIYCMYTRCVCAMCIGMYIRYVYIFRYVNTQLGIPVVYLRYVYSVCVYGLYRYVFSVCTHVSVCVYGSYRPRNYTYSWCIYGMYTTYVCTVCIGMYTWYVYLSPYVYTVCTLLMFLGTYRYVYTVCIYVSYTVWIHVSVCVYGMYTPLVSWYVSVRIYSV